MSNPLSSLSHIDVKSNNPFDLFNHWRQEAAKFLPPWQTPNVMNLATSARGGDVSNRNVVVLEHTDDGFIILTCRNSKKAQNIRENPNVAATFLWVYKDGLNLVHQIQVRVTGSIKEMDAQFSKKIFDSIPTFRKITYYIGEQDEEVNWHEMKKTHDKILNEVENGRVLDMPRNAIVYKLIPSTMEFYYTSGDDSIADRVLFTKQESTWSYKHLAP